MPEDVQGIPDVAGLADFVKATMDEQPVEEQSPQQQATEQPPQTPQLAQFKNPKDLLKSYKEIQGAFTRTTQEIKALREREAQYQEQLEIMRLSQAQRPIQQPQPQQKDFDQQFIENPQAAVESLAERKAQALLMQSKIQDVLEEESIKDPNAFNERYGYAKMLSQQFPNLVTSSAGVRKLFQIADKVREEQQKKQAFQAVKMIFGEDADLDKIRQFIKKDSTPAGTTLTNNAYMPDIPSGTRNNPEATAVNFDEEINAAVKKGDPDAVLNAMFRREGLRK